MIVRTANSTYEIDSDSRKIRRLYGRRGFKLAKDGEWMPYIRISPVVVGKPFVVLLDRTNLKGDVTSVRSSPVSRVAEDSLSGIALSCN